jgi:hypothetical protein
MKSLRNLVVGLQLALAVALAGCGCPTPAHVEQIFLLDATADASAAGADSGAGPVDCTSAAAGCAPGDACKPACDCVLARAQVSPVGKIERCTLLAGSGPAQVDVRYEIPTSCGGN